MTEVSNLLRLDGEVAVVTGGARGIGSATAAMFADAGANVVIVDRDGDAAELAAAAIRDRGGRCEAHTLDVLDEPAVIAVFDAVVSRYKRLDVLVNNAGVVHRAPAVDIPLETWSKVVGVNLTGLFLCARTAARHMIAGRGGQIVNVASIGGFSGGGHYANPAYRASKGGVVNLTRALAIEWAPHGIRVNGVAPAWVRTPMIENVTSNPDLVENVKRLVPLGRIAEPSEIAAAILFLASACSSMVTGHTLPVDGGFLAK